jgi:hypothetical protein
MSCSESVRTLHLLVRISLSKHVLHPVVYVSYVTPSAAYLDATGRKTLDSQKVLMEFTTLRSSITYTFMHKLSDWDIRGWRIWQKHKFCTRMAVLLEVREYGSIVCGKEISCVGHGGLSLRICCSKRPGVRDGIFRHVLMVAFLIGIE